MNLPGYKPVRVTTRADLERVVAEIRRARKPIVYGGGGIVASGAAPALRQFAEMTGIPVALTLHGLGGFPADHYLCLNMLGMHGTVYSNYAVNESDLLLAFGVRFDDRVTGKLAEFAKHGRIVHIDIDPSELNKNKFAHVGIHGDLKTALEGVNEILHEERNGDLTGGGRYPDWIRTIDQWREKEPLRYADRDDVILPQYAIQRLAQILKKQKKLDNAIVSTGVGQHQMWAAQYFPFNTPRHWLTSGGLGTMGFGLPAAMGAQAAHPDAIVVDIDGDGSFLMNIQELACAHVEKLPVKILLLNNQHLGMVVQWEDRFHGGNRGHTYLGAGMDADPYPDFNTIARGFGVGARSVLKKADLDAAFEEMIASDGPFLLNVHVPHQEHVLPMIPSGQSVKEIIKEPMTVAPAMK
jgi:acetolactate synthase-1/2/3 large subunit